MNIHTQTLMNQAWNPLEGIFEFVFTFAFSTRDGYLQFRREWKEHYALLSTSLRQQKELIKVTMRNREHAGAHQVKLLSLKSEARLQLLMLKAAKQEANRQYLASRSTAT